MSRLNELLHRFDDRDELVEPESVAGRDRAVLQLMLLAMFADRDSVEAERELVHQFAQSRPWPMDTDPMVEVEDATALVRRAFVTSDAFRELIRDICVRIDHPEDQAFALDHVLAMIEADDRIDDAELSFLAELRGELGLPG